MNKIQSIVFIKGVFSTFTTGKTNEPFERIMRVDITTLPYLALSGGFRRRKLGTFLLHIKVHPYAENVFCSKTLT